MAYTFTLEDINDYCSRCKNRVGCKRPCRFVEEILSYDNRGVMETHTEDGIQNFAQKRMIRFTELEKPKLDKSPSDDFTYDCDDVYVPKKSLLAKVFFLRFFQGMTNKEAAEYLDTDFELVRSAYHTAKKRMFQMLEYMDRVGKGIIVLNKYETLTDNEKMFILKYIIKLSTSQITELYGGKFTESSVNNRTFRFRNKCLKQMVAA